MLRLMFRSVRGVRRASGDTDAVVCPAPRRRFVRALAALVAATLALGALAPLADAHSTIKPSDVLVNLTQEFTLRVQAEKLTAYTTVVALTLPPGFVVQRVAPSAGWNVAQDAKRLVWSGGSGSPRTDAVFHFTARPTASEHYRFEVRQTYSDGSLVEWIGPEASEHPAVFVKASAHPGGGGSAIKIAVFAIGGVAILAGLVGVARHSGRRLA
jgi:uncharacterized protein YcnI